MAGMANRRRIAVIEGHPDAGPKRYGRALADAYAAGAENAGHEVRRIAVGALRFDVVRSRVEWESAAPASPIREAQDAIAWANHLVILYPLWLGSMPALLKAFLEQVLRPGFATERTGNRWKKKLTGRSARIVVTMGMPAMVYRWYFGAHGLKSLQRSILGFVGVRPVRSSLIGMVETIGERRRERWLARMYALGGEAR